MPRSSSVRGADRGWPIPADHRTEDAYTKTTEGYYARNREGHVIGRIMKNRQKSLK
ncbi:MAG: hypothetical protein IJ904_00320 [Candidatus Methanomethylophilaceae archaeon]|nr:hypothetical protein [Candidatus Methanomethylophilaceae archaeon]